MVAHSVMDLITLTATVTDSEMSCVRFLQQHGVLPISVNCPGKTDNDAVNRCSLFRESKEVDDYRYLGGVRHVIVVLKGLCVQLASFLHTNEVMGEDALNCLSVKYCIYCTYGYILLVLYDNFTLLLVIHYKH